MTLDQAEAGGSIVRKDVRSEDWLVGGGEMAKVIKAMDWSKTPLGPMASWPQSLRTTVSLAQASNSPISLAWGAGHVQIYNDGYWPICGAKHPTSMGQDFRECWASAFPVIGQAYATAWSGKSAYLEKMRMFLDRHGFLEETWFTFSFSPITDESGDIGGLFHPVTEMTSQMLSERRTKTLRDLAGRAGRAKTTQDVFTFSAQVLEEAGLDLPFVLFYLLDGEGKQARLVGRCGLRPGTAVSPELVDLHTQGDQVWAIGTVARTGSPRQIDDAGRRLAGMNVGPYPQSPKAAFALPIGQPGSRKPAAVMVAGVSARLLINEPYRSFFDLVAAAVSTALANARAYEEDRRKAEALAEIDRAKTAFFSNVSHEFRTPLTLILGPLEDELAEKQSPLPRPRLDRLETVHRNSLRLLKLVNTLLEFSRIEAGRAQASFEAVDLAKYTAELAAAFRSALDKAGLTFTIDCAPLPEPVYVDREMWEMIVLNLISNAFKHTFRGGLTVRIRASDVYAELTVADTGIGISPADQERLFEKFHRVKGAQSRTYEGTGIGLALVKELAAIHGGVVFVESQEGKGSTFTVRIKRGKGHLAAEHIRKHEPPASSASGAAAYVEEALRWIPKTDAAPTPASPPGKTGGSTITDSTGPAVSRPRPRILLVDDNADMRDYVQRLLTDRYEVLAFRDGLTALAAALQDPPDLILSDVMMPGLDGFGLLHKLRADPRTQTTPFILLSARAGEESAVEGLGAGADDYVVKPFSARELLARVRTHLDIANVRREAARNLERANKELEAFSYSVSHDLRAPLRAIDGYSNMLLQDHAEQLDAEGRRLLEVVVKGVQRMNALIEDLLEFSRLGRAALSKKAFDPRRVAQQVLDELLSTCPERNCESVVGAMPAAWGDPSLLRQVIFNLLSNAVKYTRPRAVAKIEISGSAGTNMNTYWVKDNGVGFEPEHAHRLFGVFQRLHSREEFEGTGVGLALVQRIVQRHGGTVWAEAAPNQGAAFYFTLPAEENGGGANPL